MRRLLECAVLNFPEQKDWLERWVKKYSSENVSFKICQVQQYVEGGAMSEIAWELLRFDIIVISVCPVSLANCRILMNKIGQSPLIRRPVFAVAYQTQDIALYDLVRMGVSDFIHLPCSEQELRVRLLSVHEKKQRTGPHAVHQSLEHTPEATQQRHFLNEKAETERYSDDIEALTYIQKSHAINWNSSSFQQAKSAIVGQFERHYIREALRRSQGNIAQAARSANKHRRAFWALMKKHDIDAEDFRDI